MDQDGAADRPLTGVRVADLTTTFMGPYCTLLLAQMGADVVKVEPPSGDVVRYIADDSGTGMGPVFLNANQGKRSIVLDLKDPAGRAALLRLVGTADVFVHNMRPDAVRRLGLTFSDVSATNPRTVYCAVRGFGSTGPYRDKAAYDDVIQAASGLAAVQGGTGEPTYVRTPVADKATGLMAVGAINAALYQRERTGRGQEIEVPMLESMVSFILLDQQGGYVFDPPRGPAGYARTSSPYRKPYRTADGYVSVMVYTDAQWRSFFGVVGWAELTDDPRFRTITERTLHIDELYRLVEEEMLRRTTAEWLSVLDAHGIPVMPVWTVPELFEDEHLRAAGMFQEVEHPSEGRLRLARCPVTFSASAPVDCRPAPRLGEHGAELLAELGYTPEEIRALGDRSQPTPT
ncbi:CoA transferase [Pseudonocardia sp. KRD-184]|uniref:CoA transferase n=1 Tax=Pseudonocardia oceani TaxID=2792013 RepID=A0ABS6U202_9PSEU|nr:CoA transferase [Pseudonocardia oceani]MBW0089596.1 CoA transferase [Pseudonocardia oceani]MBW0094870.1 CoA transferase [Pseudonocardia oceani]MBW0108188.1 CoA transferase [Pseudonocardia oceani]MBW0120569.1 CoA transferase [Pseudonocardia oceani]MBW0126277.1 CoA transferase [Pseudonocardia oceani]